MLKAFGPEVGTMMTKMIRGGEGAMKAFNKELPKGIKNVEDLGKHQFRTGRSAKDWMNLYEEQFVARFRKITGKSNKFVKDAGKELRNFGGTLEGIVKSGGPMGVMLEKMSEMHQIGVSALLPEAIRPMSMAFGTLATQLGPVADQVLTLGDNLLSLKSPFFIVGASLAAFYAMYEKNASQMAEKLGLLGSSSENNAQIHAMAMQQTKEQVFTFLTDISDKVKKWVKDDAPQLWTDLKDIYGVVEEVFNDLWKVVWPLVQPELEAGFEKFKTFATEKLAQGMEWAIEQMGEVASKAMEMALEKALDAATDGAYSKLAEKFPFLKIKFGDDEKPKVQPATSARTVSPAPPVTSSRQDMSDMMSVMEDTQADKLTEQTFAEEMRKVRETIERNGGIGGGDATTGGSATRPRPKLPPGPGRRRTSGGS
jgi:hypothetical protein